MEKPESMIGRLNNGEYDAVLKKLYVENERPEAQRVRYVNALKQFEEHFGNPDVEVYSAPGRSEIGGNHTDHQNGKVLAASVNIDAIAVVSKRADDRVCFVSEGYGRIEVDLNDLHNDPNEEGTTASLIRGMAAGFRNAQLQIGGFNAYVTSQVLSGSGLSSSAAIETLIGNIFSGLYNEDQVDAVRIAMISKYAENVYFGKPSGLMDQMACSCGGLIYIDFHDSEQPVVKPVQVDFSTFGHSLCIIDTKGSHADLTPEYAAIPQEMKQAAAYFGKELLCQVDEEAFYRELNRIRTYAGDRAVLRAAHWFNENKRVEAQVKALEDHDFEAFKALILRSGDSSYKYLQNVYAAGNPQEQGLSLALMFTEKILGPDACARVHGGGFAGTIQAFVPDHAVDAYRRQIEEYFGLGSCYVLKIRPVGGTKVM